MSEDLSVELEALRFTYPEALTLLQEEPLTVRVASSPYTGRMTVDPASTRAGLDALLADKVAYVFR